MKNRGFISFKIIAILIVFVILILVAVLLVMNFVKKDEDERLKETVINISKAAETEYNNQLLETNYPTVNIANLQYEGEKIDDGTISFDSDGHANVAIYKNNKCAYKYANTQEVVLEKGITKEECFEKIVDDIAILLQDVNYNDDNYLFSGEVYYLNPYNLDMRCQNGTDNTNENECMTWYEISEDDKYVTLILNSNLGEPIDETATITETMISYLNILTSDWDSRLALPNNTIIDGYNFSNAKARILSAYEVANIIDEPNWDKDSLSFDLELVPYLGENLDFESWYQGGFFTLTPYDEENNYVVNKYGLDISVADGYTNGVRPVIVVEKQYLDTYHNKLPEKQNLVTYISGRMITVDDNATEENIRYQVSKMRAAGIGRAFLDVGKIELVETEYVSILDADDAYSTNYVELMLKRAEETDADSIVPNVDYKGIAKQQDLFQQRGLSSDLIIRDGSQAFSMTVPWRLHGWQMIRTELAKKYYTIENASYSKFNSDEYITRLLYLKSNKIALCNAKYFYRITPESLTRSISLKKLDYLITLDKLLDLCYKENIPTKIIIEVYNNYYSTIISLLKMAKLLKREEYLIALKRIKQSYSSSYKPNLKYKIIKQSKIRTQIKLILSYISFYFFRLMAM